MKKTEKIHDILTIIVVFVIFNFSGYFLLFHYEPKSLQSMPKNYEKHRPTYSNK